jgi:hypothetical protein
MKTFEQHLVDVKKELPTGIIQDGNAEPREMTADELADWHKLCAEHRVRLDEEKVAAEAKATTKTALLDRLGITAEEAVLLLS